MSLQSLKTWLLQPYPLNNSWRSAIISGLVVGLFVMWFLYAFQPFSTGSTLAHLKICAAFGLVTFFTTLLINLLTRYFNQVFDEEKWVAWKEIAFNLCFVSSIGFGNLILAHFLWNEDLSLKSILSWQSYTFAIGLFPVVVGVLIGQLKLHQKYAKGAAQFHPKPQHPETSDAAFLIFEGENQNEQLALAPNQIAYIAAADNYVRIFYLNHGDLKNQMLRATMKKMEDTVSGHKHLFRCHRTFLVNLNLVEQVSGNAQGYRLHLEGIEESIPVSRSLNAVIQTIL